MMINNVTTGQYNGDPKQLNPVSLAFLGDGVFELFVREWLVARHGSMPASKLHAMAVQKVSASAQSARYQMLADSLTEAEADILRRGRNANSTRVPKSCSVEEYRKATGIEALFGYLYLNGDAKRMQELFLLMMDAAGEGMTGG